jgi:hypothetical protein
MFASNTPMKKISAFAVGLLGILLLAAPGNAANPPGVAPSQPVQPINPSALSPSAQLMSPFKLVAVTHPGFSKYGDFQVDVAVENITANAVQLNVTVAGLPSGGLPIGQLPVSVPGHGTQHVTFNDPSGGPMTCGFLNTKNYAITLTDGNNRTWTHQAVLAANSCSLNASTTTTIQPWNQLSPDNVQSFTAHALYIQNVTIAAPQLCSSNAKVKISLVNHTATNQTININAKDAGVLVGTLKNVTIPKNGYIEAEMVLTQQFHNNAVGAIFTIEGGTGVEQSNISVATRPSCANYTTTLDPAAAAPVVTK